MATLGRPFLTPPDASREVVALAFSGAGSRLGLAGEGGGLVEWDLGAGAARAIPYSGTRVLQLVNDAAGNVLGIAPLAGRPRLVTALSAYDLDEARPRERPVWRIAIDPSGRRAATARDGEGKVELWRVDAGKSEGGVLLALSGVAALALSEELVAAASATGVVEVCDVQTGRSIDRFDLGDRPVGLAFGPGGTVLAAASARGDVRIREPRNRTDQSVRREGRRSVQTIAWTVSGELVLGFADGRVHLPGSGREVDRLTGAVGALASVGPCPILAAAAGDVVHTIDPAAGATPEPEGHRGAVTGVLFDREGRGLWTGGSDGRLLRWTEPGSSPPVAILASPEAPIHALGPGARGLLVSAGRSVLFLDADGHEWNRKMGEGRTGFLAVDRATGRLVVPGAGTSFRLREAGGAASAELEFGGHPAAVTAAEFGSGGKRLYTGDAAGMVLVWDLVARKYLAHFRAHETAIAAIAVDPADLWIATTAHGDPVRIHDVPSGASWRDVGPGGGALAVHPGGRLLAAVGDGGEIRLIVPRSNLTWRTLEVAPARCRSLSFSADGSRLAAGLDDGTTRVYQRVR